MLIVTVSRMFLEDIFSDELQRVQFEFEDSLVEVNCLKDLELTKLDGKKITFRKGMKVRLPYWLVKILEEEGYVSSETVRKIDYPLIYKIAHTELESGSLQNIDKYFYITVKKNLDEVIAGKRSMTLHELRKIEIELRKLMTLRLNKILKIAEKEKNITTVVRNMTPEEQWLYQLVADAVKRWKLIWKTEEIKEEK